MVDDDKICTKSSPGRPCNFAYSKHIDFVFLLDQILTKTWGELCKIGTAHHLYIYTQAFSFTMLQSVLLLLEIIIWLKVQMVVSIILSQEENNLEIPFQNSNSMTYRFISRINSFVSGSIRWIDKFIVYK